MSSITVSMPSTFSKVAIVATHDITVISGLRCGHANCYALFLTFEDSEDHALEAHSCNVVAVTCNIHEKKMESGQVQLYRVPDKDGENTSKNKFTSAYQDIESTVAAGDDGTQVTSLRNAKDKTPSVHYEIAPAGGPLVETILQSTVSTPGSQGLSRQSTDPAIDMPLSVSSFSSSSSFSSASFSSVSSDDGEIGDQKLARILAAVQEEMVGECRICWVQRETTKRPHTTFKCSTGICSGKNWGRFKVGLQFPKNVVCYF